MGARAGEGVGLPGVARDVTRCCQPQGPLPRSDAVRGGLRGVSTLTVFQASFPVQRRSCFASYHVSPMAGN